MPKQVVPPAKATRTAAPAPAKPAAPAPNGHALTPVGPTSAIAAAMAESTVTGFEEATSAAYAIPFLRVLQDLSPQVKSKMAGYIPGARPGQIFNTVSRQVYDRVRVVPCYFQQTQIEWIPRAKAGGGGGGFVAAHPANTPLLSKVVRGENKRPLLPNGHELMDTRSHYVLVLKENGEAPEGVLIAMSSTGLKISRAWMSQMKVACAPSKAFPKGLMMYSHSYELSTEEVSNDQGQWWQFVVGDRQDITDLEIFRQAQQFASGMQAGQVKVDYTELRESTHEETEGGVPEDLDNDIDA